MITQSLFVVITVMVILTCDVDCLHANITHHVQNNQNNHLYVL